MKELRVKWTGIRPLILHNGELADPTNPFTIKIKDLTSKRKKTVADYEAIAKLEWEGALYWDEEHGVIMPSDCIERTVQVGAQKSRLGKDVQAAVFVQDEVVKVNYDGPKTKEKMYADPRFVLRKGVRIQKNRVIKVRPMIPTGWNIMFTLEYDENIVNQGDLVKAMIDAGTLVGLCDWRPKFGRFLSEVIK